jgi:hypothetical protein
MYPILYFLRSFIVIIDFLNYVWSFVLLVFLKNIIYFVMIYFIIK